VTPRSGGIDGNTPITVSGTGFGAAPELYLGGQRLSVESVLPRDTAQGREFDEIHARTLPNEAGPASVRVVTAEGLSDEVIGAFTYVDELMLSFIDPAVVRVTQAGQGDVVRVVGHGFHRGIVLRAWQSGRPQTVVQNHVDGDRLKLVIRSRPRASSRRTRFSTGGSK
jgi:hypothetical protein